MASLRKGLLTYRDEDEDVDENEDEGGPLNPSTNITSQRHGKYEPSRSCHWLGKRRDCPPAILGTRSMIISLLLMLFLGGLLLSSILGNSTSRNNSCNTIETGFQCHPKISHFWGQYSPFFSLEHQSAISPDVPKHCRIIFVQVLSRHGARYPTSIKTNIYSDLISRIQRSTTSFEGDFAFLKDYVYNLGADDLTSFGEKQMIQSGASFYARYKGLAKNIVPFFRCSGSDRVVASGQRFIAGFQTAKRMDSQSNKSQHAPEVNVIIGEGGSYNNTLDPATCSSFDRELGQHMQDRFAERFLPSILERLKANLPGVNLSLSDLPYLMDMCPFHTVARDTTDDQLSPFCSFFTENEWHQYDYYQSLGKYYGRGGGNSLGAVQGVGFVNELIARMTDALVQDHTTVNHTLDSNPETFPLHAELYADFSHDNAMTSIFTALGLYNGTKKLSPTEIETILETNGYSAAWTVPFAARSYIEMMLCGSEEEPFIRVLVNDRVVPLHGCKVDSLGRCRRDDFVQGLSFARDGGNWASCHAND
ncbi:Histidine phosphatase superfamily [Elaphomyces granulatus]